MKTGQGYSKCLKNLMGFCVVLLMISMSVLLYILVCEDPIRVGFGLALYSTTVSVVVGLEWSSYFGYLVFFVYVGTLMVMFSMVVRLAPNPLFQVVPFMCLFFLCFGGVCAMELVGGMREYRVGELELGWVRIGRVLDVRGFMYEGLGLYGGVIWGGILVFLGLVLMLSVVSVANLCKRSSGPLVRFVEKGGCANKGW